MTPGMACGMNSTTLVLMSHMSARATAISMPMNPGADDHGVLHAAGSAGLAERVGVLKVVRAAHVFEVAAFDRGHFGSAAGGDDQAVVGERLLFARDQVLAVTVLAARSMAVTRVWFRVCTPLCSKYSGVRTVP